MRRSIKFCGECGTALGGDRSTGRRDRRPSAPAAERRLVSVLFADLVGFTAALRGARRRGDARAPLALLRHVPAADRALRRHGREVHRRRGDGRLGHADRDRGRRRARGPRRARPRRRRLGARRRGRRRRAAGARRRPHRRGRGHDRRRGPGHGRRRPRQHRLADPVGRRAGHRLRRRGDAARDRADDRLRGRRRARAQGQGRACRRSGGRCGSSPARAARSSRTGSRRRSSAATASCARSRSSSTPRAEERKAHLVSVTGHRRDRQVAARLGVLQVLRRPRRRPSTGTAAAASPTARASTYWALADMVRMRCRIARGRGAGVGARRSCAPTLEEHILDPEERRFVEPRLAHLLGLGEHEAARPAGPVRRLAALLRAPGRALSDGARLRGHAVGGREPARLRRVPARVVAQPPDLRDHARAARAARAPADLGRRAAQLHVALPRAALAAGDGGAARRARARAARTSCATRSSPARRASRCTRSRPCGCCSTAACSSRTAPCTGRPGAIEALEVPETLHALIAARLDGLSTGGAAAAPGRGRARQDLHASRRSPRCRPAREAELEPLLVVARAQGGARRPGRPALARARPVRLPPGPRPPRRLRDALEARAPGQAPRGGRAPEHGRSRDEDEVVEVVASHYLDAHEAAPDADDAAEIKRKAQATLVRAGERAASLAAAAEARRYFEQAARARGRAVGARRASRPRGRDGRESRRSRRPRAALFEESIAPLRGAWATHTPPPGQPGGSGDSTSSPSDATRRWRGMERAFAVIVGGRARRGPRAPRGAPAARVLVRRRSRACCRAGRARVGYRRSAAHTRRRSPSRCARRRPSLDSRGHNEEAMRSQARARDRARARPVRGREHVATSSSPTAASGATYADALDYLDEVSRARAQAREPPARVGCARRADVSRCDARSLGRGAATSDGFTQEQVDSGEWF